MMIVQDDLLHLNNGDFITGSGPSLLAQELLQKESLKNFSPKNSSQEGLSCYRLGKLFYDKADLLSAEELFLKSLTLWKKPDDVFFALKSLGFLIKIASERLEDDKVARLVEESENILFANVVTLEQSHPAEYFYKTGVVYNYRGNSEKAQENFFQALHEAVKEGRVDIEAKARYTLATTYLHEKNIDEALLHLQCLEVLIGPLKKHYMNGAMHLLYGQIYSEMGNYARSLEHFGLSHTILLEKTCWNLIGQVLLGKGIVYKRLGQLNKAQFYFEFALQTINPQIFRRVTAQLKSQINEITDRNVDLILDCTNRIVYEREIGAVCFKHRFILLEILLLLARNPGTIFTKEELTQKIWRDKYHPLIHDKLIYTSMSRLRKLIGPKSEKKCYIVRDKDGYALAEGVKVRFHEEGDLDKKPRICHVELSTPV